MNAKAAQRPQKMPGKTVIGLAALWVVTAYLLFASAIVWIDVADHGGLGEFDEMLVPIVLGIMTLLNLVPAVGIHLRRGWARKTAIVVGVVGIGVALISLGASPLGSLMQILVSVLVIAMIASVRTEEWCDRLRPRAPLNPHPSRNLWTLSVNMVAAPSLRGSNASAGRMLADLRAAPRVVCQSPSFRTTPPRRLIRELPFRPVALPWVPA
ncbi:hypothetical protein [Glycomyces sp. YM15]|uniref:hypothetical protein n=1 Tax=Glycomyces sp. YM15 TaxID=2800446 RepID=UPI001966113E|nr:hypothetical protein [Glycomyces sp. YM15]